MALVALEKVSVIPTMTALAISYVAMTKEHAIWYLVSWGQQIAVARINTAAMGQTVDVVLVQHHVEEVTGIVTVIWIACPA